MKPNPIVVFLFFIGLIFNIFLMDSLIYWWVPIFIIFIILLMLKIHVKSLIHRMKPFLIFLPYMTAIYIIFSLLLTEDPLLVVIKNSGLSFLKIGLVVMVMSIYVGLINPDRLINALRSIWVSLNLPWKFVENGFLFIELIFRFYPTMKLEWERITNSRKILHIDRVRTRLERVKQYADDIPGLIVYAFQKSEETAEIMEMRGYGRNFPRGLANPIPFRMVDFLLIILISIIFIGLNNYVQV